MDNFVLFYARLQLPDEVDHMSIAGWLAHADIFAEGYLLKIKYRTDHNEKKYCFISIMISSRNEYQ